MRYVGLALAFVLAAGLATLSLPARAEPELPAISRHVPRHPDALLTGCTTADRLLVERRITTAIGVGAPQYNDGDFLGCYQTYERAARMLEMELPGVCAGPIRALREGRQVALAGPSPAHQAWAMRDTFDGLLLLLDRVGLDP